MGHHVVVAVRADVVESLRAKFAAVLPHLDERQQRLVLAGEARSLGHGGIAAVAQASGASRSRISQGVAELEAGQAPLGRVRRAGGGRKPLTATDPALLAALLALVEPTRRGDPCSPLCWTTQSTRKLAAELTSAGHQVGADTVARLLREQGFSLQANAKTIEGGQHPDRDAQFCYLNDQAKAHLSTGDPVISVDTKKKELVGDYNNGGAEWRPAGQPEQVKVHDFIDPALGKANPYGVYDLAANTGWVSVGTDHDTAAFAVETIRRWWAVHRPHLLPARDPAADHRRRRRLQRLPHPAVEDRTGRPGRRDRPAHHRLPPAARHLEVEQDRAPAVLPHLHELARPTPDQPRRHRGDHRRDHHPHRAERARRTRHHRLPHRREDPRRADERPRDTGTLRRHDWHPEWNYTLNPPHD